MEMIVNIDLISIDFEPTCGARTWAKRGSKYVLVHEMEDKRQVTVSLFSLANGNLLHFQVVFTGLTDKCLPPRNTCHLQCEGTG